MIVIVATMRVQSINVAMPKAVDMGAGPETTAIFKAPTSGPVSVDEHGLAGDRVGQPEHHGGPDQAIYVYFGADYHAWERLLDRDLDPGTFGDNLTVEGAQTREDTVSSMDLFVGDRLRIGAVMLEVTAPRIPCGTFSRRMGLPKSFIDQFRKEMRPGVYTRVVSGGSVSVGDPVAIIPGDQRIGVTQLVEWWGQRPDIDTIDRVLAAPIAERVRLDYERKRTRAIA